LFIAALDDPTVPAALYANMNRLVPNLTIKTVHTGHWAMAEDPKGLNEHLTAWISEVALAKE
jgi:pimeloyl-ACP methyl ester carboxylesterase